MTGKAPRKLWLRVARVDSSNVRCVLGSMEFSMFWGYAMPPVVRCSRMLPQASRRALLRERP